MNKYAQYSRVPDARGYGYTAKQAFYEHNQEKSMPIHKGVVTKKGLTMYSDKEVADKSSEVKTTNVVPARITWSMFKKMPSDAKQDYLDSIKERYPSLPQSSVARMMGINPGTFNQYLVMHSLKFAAGKKGSAGSLDKEKFNREMMKGVLPLRDKPVAIVETPTPSPEKKATPIVMGCVEKAFLKCDAKDLAQAISQLGFVGTVSVSIYKTSGKEQDTDGLK